ncbi:MAG: SDR family oxidoreductase [Peptococcaceae bacterium]|nr:SDR family oxidoreductase [Peptococcaceae bacterium]
MGYRQLSFPHGTRFLVTGGAGFIGSNIAEALLTMGYMVRILDDFSTGLRENVLPLMQIKGLELIEGSIVDFEVCRLACSGIDYVLHQAAWGSVPRSIKMPLHYDTVNVHGTLNMMQAALEAKVKKFVYASSSSVYGNEATLPKVEGREGMPLSPYAITKTTNELYAKNYYDIYGLQTVGLRYFNVFGRRQDPHSTYAAVIPLFVRELLADRSPVIHGDGTQSRDFTYIDNAIEANLRACLAAEVACGQAFNIAYGQCTSIYELYFTLCRLLNKKLEPIYGPIRAGDIPHSLADISKARTLLGYTPEFDFAQGLEATIEWYVARAAGLA